MEVALLQLMSAKSPFLFISCFLLLLCSNPGASADQTPLATQSLLNHLAPSECKKDQTHYSACMEVFTALGLISEPRNWIVPSTSDLDVAKLAQRKNEIKIREQNWTTLFQLHAGNLPPNVGIAAIDEKRRNFSPDEFEALALHALSQYEKRLLNDDHAEVLTFGLRSSHGSSEERLEGIGISYLLESNGLRLLEVLPETPAAESGLRAGDLITHIENETMEKKLPGEFIRGLFGKSGSSVLVGYLRGPVHHDVNIQRRPYEVLAFESKVKTVNGILTGVLKLRSFLYPGACSDMRDKVMEYIESGVQGFVLDLRDNAGGDVYQAKCIAGIFLEHHKVLFQRQNIGSENRSDEIALDPEPIWEESTDHTLYPEVLNPPIAPAPPAARRTRSRFPIHQPLVIALNARSASATELLAVGLRDHGRALIVGERSFGKGCGQTTADFDIPGLKLLSTRYYFLRPTGSSVQHLGIRPDVSVQSAKSEYREMQLFPRSLPAYGKPNPPPWTGLEKLLRCVTDRRDIRVTAEQSLACWVLQNRL